VTFRDSSRSERESASLRRRLAAWLLLIAALGVTLSLRARTRGFLPGHHGYQTALALSMAKNLDARHHYLMFTRKILNEKGEETLSPHNRLPIGSFLALALVTRLCHDDPMKEIEAGKILMLLCFWGSLVTSFLIVAKLTGRVLLAAAVSLLAFSSYYMQYYDDMVFNDIPALFAFLLLLLGIARCEKDGKRGLLYAATFLAIFLGWQGFAPLVAWWCLRLIPALASRGRELGARMRDVLRHPSTRALVTAALWGGLLLAWNLTNEKAATKTAFADLPSVRSIFFRVGLSGGVEEYPEYPELAWSRFLPGQARRLMKATIPTRPLHARIARWGDRGGGGMIKVLAVLAAGGALLCLLTWFLWRAGESRLLWGVIAASGFFWTIPMRNFTPFHDFQSLFYVGFVLLIYAALLSPIPSRILPMAALVGFATFAFSSYDLNAVKQEEGRAGEARVVDCATLRKVLGRDRKIQVGADPKEFSNELVQMRYYLAGNYFADPAVAELVLTSQKDSAAQSLTPHNEGLFLFAAPPSIKP
jgi:hypothetical protein